MDGSGEEDMSGGMLCGKLVVWAALECRCGGNICGYPCEKHGLWPCQEEGMATHFSIPAWRIPMGRGAWWATAHGVAKSQTRLGD